MLLLSAFIKVHLGPVAVTGPWDDTGRQSLALQCHCSLCKEKRNPQPGLRVCALLGSVQSPPSVPPIKAIHTTEKFQGYIQYSLSVSRPRSGQQHG